MGHLAENIDLVVGKLCKFWCLFKFVSIHNFYCKELFGLLVLGSIHISILSSTNLLLKYIVLNRLIHSNYNNKVINAAILP